MAATSSAGPGLTRPWRRCRTRLSVVRCPDESPVPEWCHGSARKGLILVLAHEDHQNLPSGLRGRSLTHVAHFEVSRLAPSRCLSLATPTHARSSCMFEPRSEGFRSLGQKVLLHGPVMSSELAESEVSLSRLRSVARQPCWCMCMVSAATATPQEVLDVCKSTLTNWTPSSSPTTRRGTATREGSAESCMTSRSAKAFVCICE